jgi:hypothetical protein
MNDLNGQHLTGQSGVLQRKHLTRQARTSDSPCPNICPTSHPNLNPNPVGPRAEAGEGPQAIAIGQVRHDIIVALMRTYGCSAARALETIKFFENSMTSQPPLRRQPLSSVPNADARNLAKSAPPTSPVTPPPPPAEVPAPSVATIVPEVPPSPESTMMDACLEFAADWAGTNLDHAVQLVTAMIAKLPIERVHHHFAAVARAHRSGRRKLDLVDKAIDRELLDLAQPDLFGPSPAVAALGATSPPAGAAPPPSAVVLDLPALRECAAQIAAWRPDLDGPTAQRIATAWMTAAGAQRLTQYFAAVGARKRSGAYKFGWIEERIANPRPLRPARRKAQGSAS